MAKLIVRDHSKKLKKLAKKVIKDNRKEFGILGKINILFVWRLGESPRYDDEDRAVAAQTRVLPPRERDIYGFDVEIEVFKDSWLRKSKKARYRLMWHELYHIDVEQSENFKPNRDDDGRIIIKMRKHDITVTTFNDEVKKFGIQSRDVPDAVALSKALRKREKKKQ